MQRALFVLGIVISLVGLAWPWISKLPLGRLPGDILIERPGTASFAQVGVGFSSDFNTVLGHFS